MGLSVVPVGATVGDKPIDEPIESPEQIKEATKEEGVETEAKELAAELGGGEIIDDATTSGATSGVDVAQAGAETVEGEKVNE